MDFLVGKPFPSRGTEEVPHNPGHLPRGQGIHKESPCKKKRLGLKFLVWVGGRDNFTSPRTSYRARPRVASRGTTSSTEVSRE